MLRIILPFVFVSAVLGTYGGGGGYAEYADCGGSCGGGCGSSGSYSSPCGGQAAPVVQYESSGCDSGDCGGGGGGGHSSRYSSGRAASSGYHKSVTTFTKETRNDHLKIVVGQPVVHRTTYVQPAPQPQVVYKKARYVDEGSNYGGGGGGGDYDCGGQCGGGSKIVKIIKKTTYSGGDGGGVCTTCDYSGGGGGASYSSNIEYSQPIVRKVTRIVTQPKIVRIIKTSVVSPVESSGEYYEDSGSSGCGGGGCGNQGGGYTSKRYTSGGSGGHGGGGGRSKAFAFASASASAGAGGGSSGDYSQGGGGGCKSGCDEWKK